MTKPTLLPIFILLSHFALAQSPSKQTPQGEVVYHVCQRSFYDSNSDLHGDLNGLIQKLPYLQDLGGYFHFIIPLV